MLETVAALTLAIAIAAVAAVANADEVRIGVGSAWGRISPRRCTRSSSWWARNPMCMSFPIVPPGDVDACVKRFVAGETDDRLDGVMVVSLPDR